MIAISARSNHALAYGAEPIWRRSQPKAGRCNHFRCVALSSDSGTISIGVGDILDYHWWQQRVWRTGKMLLFASACLVASAAQPAGAQGIFELLFGSAPRFVRPSLPPQIRSYADPGDRRETRRHSGDSGGSSGHSTVFCVRTCDGRYFPLQHHAGVSPAELCQSFCPASKTMVFSGSKIDYAVAHNGRRYADLDNAFAYRDKVAENCTCNGKDGLGLARSSCRRSDAAAGRHRCNQ